MNTSDQYEPRGTFDLTSGRMKEARGDMIRLADCNFPVPGVEEVGLFAVPYVQTQTGSVAWVLCDGTGKIQANNPTLSNLVLWIVRNYNDKAHLTDCARGLI